MAQTNTNFYDLLKVPHTASVQEINQAYRKLAREFHPDKNPSAGDIFKEISYAHEVLTDHDKRMLYDRYGVEGLHGGISRQSPINPFSLFPHLLGGSFFGLNPGMGLFTSYPPHQRRVDDTVYIIKVTLEDLFAGQTIEYVINRSVICASCDGKGAKSNFRLLCPKCVGSGHTFENGIFPIAVACSECNGVGTVIPEHDRCTYCLGASVRPESIVVEVVVEKGMKDSDRIVFFGYGDQAPGAEPGNVVFVLEEQPHSIYQRVGHDLCVTKEIDLLEALCGCVFALQYLNGNVLKIVQPVGESIKHGQVKGLPNKGMPIRGHLARRGNLYVRFNVKFPPNNFASEVQLQMLEKILGPRPELSVPNGDNAEEVELLDFDPKIEMNGHQNHHNVRPNSNDNAADDPHCVPQ